MIRELRDKWIEALESGKYNQIVHHLGDEENGRCCLGVLCDIEGYTFERQDKDRGINGVIYKRIEELMGIRNTQTLMGKNDGGDTFKEIASWIKENL